MSHQVKAFDWFLFASLVCAWGSSFVMSKLALAYVAPAWIAASRLVVGAAVLALVALLQRGTWEMDFPTLMICAWLGLVGNAAPFFVITWGMQFITSGVAGLLMGTIPLIVILLSHFVLPGERLTLLRTLGFILGFIGIVALMGPEKLLDIKGHGLELMGELAVVAGCLLYGVNAVSAKLSGLKGSIAASAMVLGFGALMATALALVQAPFDLHRQPAEALLPIIGLGLIPTGLATAAWFKLIARTGPGFTAMSNYLVPVYSLFFGAAILGESIGWNVLAALAFILAGIFVSRLSTVGARP